MRETGGANAGADERFGPYQLVRRLAVGGMAEIYLARTVGIAGFEKYIALKMIRAHLADDDDFIGMLVDEAHIAVQLAHPNIAQTFDLGRVDDSYYIAMEYVDGADLRHVLEHGAESNVEFPLDVGVYIAAQVARGLDYAHRKTDLDGQPLGIIHRDVSPHNILISFAGDIKLVDFGIAKARLRRSQTAAGVIKGKYNYLSPEQAWGGSIDDRTDIFAAGIVLYEMLTGAMLYMEDDLHALLELARKAEIPRPTLRRPDVPATLESIVMRALSRELDERYQTAGELANDLERFLHGHAPMFTPAKLAAMIAQVAEGTNDMAGASISGEMIARTRDEIRLDHSMIGRPAEARDAHTHVTKARVDTGPRTDARPRVKARSLGTKPRIDARPPLTRSRGAPEPRVITQQPEPDIVVPPDSVLAIGDVSQSIVVDLDDERPMLYQPRTIAVDHLQRAATDREVVVFVDHDEDDLPPDPPRPVTPSPRRRNRRP